MHFNNTIEKCKFFVHNQIFFILKLKCVKVLELVFQKRVFPYYIWILIIYCSFKKRGLNWGSYGV